MKSYPCLLSLPGIAVLMLLAAPPASAAVLYDLASVKLDGTAGENTFILGDASLALGGGNSALTQANNSSSFSYFVGYFTSTSLVDVGDAIVLSFTGTATNFASTEQSFRFGLFNAATQLTGNSTNVDQAAFYSNRGYRADYNPGSAGGNTASLLRERTGDSNNLYSTGASPGLASTPSNLPYLSLTTSPFSGTFSIEKTSTGVLVTSEVNGTTSVTAIDDASAFTTFNTVSFFISSQDASHLASLTFSDFQVSLVPEPSSLALGLTASVALLSLRRKRASLGR